MWALSTLIRDQTCVPCIERQILNHWATRKVPALFFNKRKTYRNWNIIFSKREPQKKRKENLRWEREPVRSSGKQRCISGKEKSTQRDFIRSEGFITINSTGKKWSRRYRTYIWDFTTKEDVFMKPLSEKSTCYCLGMLGSRWKRGKKRAIAGVTSQFDFFFFSF